jgi:predicted permease
MLRNYFTIALRNLWRNRLYTFLNVLGLAIGLSACWVVYRLTSYELAFDRQHPHRDRTYRVVTRVAGDGEERASAGVPTPLIGVAGTQLPGVERALPYFERWMANVYVPQAGGPPKRFPDVDDVVATGGAYFDFFQYRWLAGHAARALDQPDRVVLTESRAAQYFPGVPPAQVIGRSLLYFDTLAVTVAGVVADPALPTSFDPKEILSVSTLRRKDRDDAWASTDGDKQLLVRLSPRADPDQVQQQLNAIAFQKGEPVYQRIWNKSSRGRRHVLQPLAEVHFGTEYGDKKRSVNWTVLYGLMGLAGFILLLAVVNYLNLASAQIPQRSREIGLRKVLGARPRSLLGQFLLETLLVTLVALGVAFGLSDLFTGAYGHLLPPGSTTYVNWLQVAVFLLVLVGVVSVLAGWYPAWLAARLQPASMLRGQVLPLAANSRLTLRKSLIVFQFLIAQVFIIGALVIGQQLRYALHHDMGFDREAVVTLSLPSRDVPAPRALSDQEAFRNRLAQLPGVSAVSLGRPPASPFHNNNEWTYTGKRGKVSFMMNRKWVDTAYVGLYRLPLLAGRNLHPSDTAREFVINETALKAMGLQHPREAIGQTLTETGGNTTPIVGVVRDFHILSFHEKIPAVALMMHKENLGEVSIRLASRHSADWPATLRRVEQVWRGIYAGEEFSYRFYDQTIAQFYEQERTVASIINLATAVAVFISCLGLFGLAAFTAGQRTKEIGIRKVLGASVASIVTLLSKDFVRLVCIAMLLATPAAWYAAQWWLQDFAYRVELKWLVFALAGVLSLGIALLTVGYQSIRAALANPADSLRSE